MPLNESPSVSVSVRGHRRPGSDPDRTVVWICGDHDIATRPDLSIIIAEVCCLDEADIVIDLSGVTFMDASTIGVLVVARDRLRPPSRSLSVRAPSPPARRILEVCGLAELIDEHAASTPPRAATALGTWVDVPPRDRRSDAVQPAGDRQQPTTREPARGTAPRREAQAGSVPHPRAPS